MCFLGSLRRFWLFLLVPTALPITSAEAQQANFISLGFLPGSKWTRANAVSADGSIVVGDAIGTPSRAFRWTAAGGMQALGNAPGWNGSFALGISTDGAIVTGEQHHDGVSIQACRWTPSGVELLGGLPGFLLSSASSVSTDGATIAGASYLLEDQAVRWINGVAESLGDLPGGQSSSYAQAMSADGAVIVGLGSSSSGTEAFRWTAAGGMQGLGDLPGGNFYSTAMSTSADGSIVVGWANGLPGPGAEAFRWTESSGLQGMGKLPGATSSIARGISGDGQVIVGASNFFGGDAFVWTSAIGMKNLRQHLIDHGATGLGGWKLESANAISTDGTKIVGEGVNPSGLSEAWLAIIPSLAPCLGDLTGDKKVDQADLGALLAAYGTCPGQPGYNALAGALGGDPCVTQADLGVLLAEFGKVCE